MWAKAIDQHAAKSVNRILVGNKCDLVDKRQISTEKGKELSNEFGIQFFETSAKNATSVEEAFLTLARDIKKRVDSEDGPTIDKEKDTKVNLNEHANGDAGEKKGVCNCSK